MKIQKNERFGRSEEEESGGTRKEKREKERRDQQKASFRCLSACIIVLLPLFFAETLETLVWSWITVPGGADGESGRVPLFSSSLEPSLPLSLIVPLASPFAPSV